MSTYIKLSKSQLTKIIQLGRLLGKMLGYLGKKKLLDLAVSLAKDILPKLGTKPTSSVLDKIEIKINWERIVWARKGFTLFSSNEDMGDIIKFVESLEKSSLIDGATETVKHEIKKQTRSWISWVAASLVALMVSSMMKPVAFSLINAITEKGQEGGFLPLLALVLMMKV